MTGVSKRFRQLINQKDAAFNKGVDDEHRRNIAHEQHGKFPLDTPCVHFGGSEFAKTSAGKAHMFHLDMAASMHANDGSLEFHSAELEYWYEVAFNNMVKQAHKMVAEMRQ